MVSMRQRTRVEDGVTFAHVVVENEGAQRRRVRLALRVHGAVWPPRRRGRPAPGWDSDGVTLVVAGGDTRGVGFATPGSVSGDVVDVVADVPHAESEGMAGGEGHACEPEEGDGSPSTAAVVDALGSFAPPLAATPRVDASDGGLGDSSSAADIAVGSTEDAAASRSRSVER